MKKNSSTDYLSIAHTVSNMSSSPVKYEMHIHDSYELYYFLQGDVTYYIEGQGYKIEAKDLLIINNNELHRPVFNSNIAYERIIIHFIPWYFSRYNTDKFNLLSCFEERELGQSNKIPKDSVIKYKLDKHYLKIIDYINSNKKEANIMIETLFVQLLVKINRIFQHHENIQTQSTDYDEKVLKIINFINNNLDKKISLNLLEKNFYLNKYYLSHLFKENTGFSVQQYINYKKIIKAKELLSQNLSCSDVCNKLSFGDYSNFYKAFKKNVGFSPQKYKQDNII